MEEGDRGEISQFRVTRAQEEGQRITQKKAARNETSRPGCREGKRKGILHISFRARNLKRVSGGGGTSGHICSRVIKFHEEGKEAGAGRN